MSDLIFICSYPRLKYSRSTRAFPFTIVKKGGSRNLVGIAIQLSDSEQEKLLVGYSMLISPEKFDFGIE